MILHKKKKESLDEFGTMCQDILGIDKNLIVNYASSLINYYGASDETRKVLRVNQNLENKWYQALQNGSVDYSVYSEPIYNSDMFACWTVYSRKYLLQIQKYFINKGLTDKIRNITDLGCGAGLTTSGFVEMFPNAEITGTNIENTAQIKLCRFLAKKNGFKIETDISNLVKTDLLFGSEYFEHIKEPISHLRDLIKITNPEIVIIANAFGTTSVGHFYTYTVNGVEIEGKKMSKIFNNELSDLGYKKLKTGWWNNRPSLWVKK